MMSRIDSRHWKISTDLHFQNGRHNTENSTSFHSFCYAPLVKRRNFSHLWKKSQIFNRDSCKNLLIYLHMKCRWNRTMLNLCCIVVAILKMETGRNFSMSGINIYPHIKFWWYRKMFNLYRPFWHKICHSDMSPLEEQFSIFKIFKMSAIFKLAAKTRHKNGRYKLNIFRYHQNLICG
jgi:hypothetical protein